MDSAATGAGAAHRGGSGGGAGDGLGGRRIAVVVSRYNESVTRRLLDGALACAVERGLGDRVSVYWVAGAWELPVAVRRLVSGGRYGALCALGAVIRGETPHFEYVAGECARGLMQLQVEYGVPIGFGVLTTDNLEQALERAGGAAGNKGHEALSAALDAARETGGLDAGTP